LKRGQNSFLAAIARPGWCGIEKRIEHFRQLVVNGLSLMFARSLLVWRASQRL